MSHNHIKNNVIRFPVERIKGRRPLPEEFPEPASEDDDYPENEWFEREDELWAKEDFKELIQLHKNQLMDWPEDNFARFSLAQAYFFNYDYDEALKTLHELHEQLPDDPDVLYFIVETLAAAGRTGDDFNWVKKPDILPLDANVLDACWNMLKPGHKACDIDHLFNIFSDKGYLMFNREQLLAALASDPRFLVDRPESPDEAEVTIAPFSERPPS